MRNKDTSQSQKDFQAQAKFSRVRGLVVAKRSAAFSTASCDSGVKKGQEQFWTEGISGSQVKLPSRCLRSSHFGGQNKVSYFAGLRLMDFASS